MLHGASIRVPGCSICRGIAARAMVRVKTMSIVLHMESMGSIFVLLMCMAYLTCPITERMRRTLHGVLMCSILLMHGCRHMHIAVMHARMPKNASPVNLKCIAVIPKTLQCLYIGEDARFSVGAPESRLFHVRV